jgi:meso-butanediol dehydrogenase / (S,S)-butanediol dehydrogenase / diacetyl reductase
MTREDLMRLHGKVALITGGGTGIGAAIARRFVAEGAKVCITGRRQGPLDEVAGSLPDGAVITVAGDVSRHDDVHGMVEAALAFGGRLDVLVNNAALDQAPASVVDLDLEDWDAVLRVNLTGPFLLMQHAIPAMLRTGGGSIVNVASLAGLRAIPQMPSYCASKGGLVMLTQQVALDFGPHNIRCNVICPGAVRTEMIEGAMGHFSEKLGTDVDGVLARFSRNVPLRRVALPDEVAGLSVYLASDESAFMTGAVIPIDGGAAIVDISGAAISEIVAM